MLGFLRFVQLLAIVIWLGGLIFFAFVLAPTAFGVLPSIHDAGLVVGSCLKLFDKLSLGCGTAFLAVTALLFRRAAHRIKGRYEMEFLLAGVMLLFTAYLQFNVIPNMDNDQRLAGGDIDKAESTNPARIHFNKLHARSENVAGAVLVIGLGVLFLMSREHARIEG
jgi:uncharacterized membrane protein